MKRTVKQKQRQTRAKPAQAKQPIAKSLPGDPAIKGTITLTRDTTNRKRAEEGLRESEERYRTLVETSPDAITLTDLDGRIIVCNQQSAALYGAANVAEMVGKDSLEIIAPEDRQHAIENLQKILPKGSLRGIEYTMLRKDGSRYRAELSASTIPDATGKPYAFIGIVRDITERKRAEMALARRADEFAALYETTRDLAELQDLPTLLETIVERAIRLLHGSGGGMYLYDTARGDLQVHVTTHSATPVGTRLQIGEGMAGRVAQSRQPLIVDDYRTWPYRSSKYPDTPLTAVIEVPMLFGGALIGVLVVEEVGETGHKFSEEDARLLSFFAAQAASAVYNARLLTETQRRADEFAALHETTRDLAAQHDLAVLLQTAVERAMSLLSTPCGFIYLYDAAQSNLVLTVEKGLETRPGIRLQMGEGVAGRVAQTRQPLIVDNYSTWEHRAPQYAGVPYSALVEVPMLYGGELIGVLGVSEIGATTRRFAEKDARLLSLFASQAASAVNNARLLAETKRRADEFAALYDVTRDLAMQQRDLPALLRMIVERATTLLSAPGGGIYLYDLERGDLEMVAPKGNESTAGVRLHLGEGLAGRVAQTRQPMILDNYSTWEHRSLQYTGIPISAVVQVPMLYGGDLIGVLAVHEIGATTRRFTEQDARLLSLFAAQAASAVYNARLLAETQRRADELALINQISAAINQPLALSDVLTITLRELTRVLDTDRGAIAIFAESREHLTIIAEHNPSGGPSALHSTIPLAGNPSMEYIVRERRPLAVADVPHDPILGDVGQFLHSLGIQSMLILPLIAQDQVIGTVGLDTVRHPRVFTGAEIALAQTIAHQAAAAIDKARLLKAEQTRRAELATLYDLSRTLADIGERNTILELITRRAAEATNVTFARLATWEGKDLIVRAAHSRRNLDHDLRIGIAEPMAQPLYQRVLQQGAPVTLYVDDPEISNAVRQTLFLDLAHTLCLVPLSVGDQSWGVLMLGEERGEGRAPFTREKIDLVRNIADQAASALQRATLRTQTEQHVQRLSALRNIDVAISNTFDLRVSLNILVDQVITQLKVDAAAILLLNVPTQTLEYAVGRGFRSNAVMRSHLRLGEGYAGRAAVECRTIEVRDWRSEIGQASSIQPPTPIFQAEGFVFYFAVPLLAKGQVKGVLEVFHRAPLEPDRDWLDFMQSLAGQAALAVDNTLLFEGLQRSNLDLSLAYDTTLEGWSRALDLRDRETEGHTQRVVDTTLRLAQLLGFSDADLVHVRRGALLHDIGKMGIPDSILFKPGPLTDAEWQIMRRHPAYAYELLSPIDYLKPALDIPHCHHEKWDGSGYPRGLKDEEIPLSARIFAVVDVWDALRSDRPYRTAWTEERVREYIREQSGKHFDPKVVQLFLTLGNEEIDA